jgi:hypothetical protein
METGVTEKLRQDTMRYEPRRAERAVKSMELVDVIPIFSISISGIVVAIFLVFLEQLFASILRRRHQNTVMTNNSNLLRRDSLSSRQQATLI